MPDTVFHCRAEILNANTSRMLLKGFRCNFRIVYLPGPYRVPNHRILQTDPRLSVHLIPAMNMAFISLLCAWLPSVQWSNDSN